jgi:hypothetical protein
MVMASPRRPTSRAAAQKLVIVLAALLAQGCGESLNPSDVLGIYVLQQVANDPLPAVLHSNDDVTVRVFAETLYFASTARGTFSTVREAEPATGEPPSSANFKTGFGFQTIDDGIEVGFDCPINANCVAPPHLVLRWISDGLRADFALSARTPLIYARLPETP